MSTFTIQTDGLNTSCPEIMGNPPGEWLTVQLTGNGIQQGLILNPTMLDFGNTLLDTTSKKSVMLSNASTVQITGIGTTVTGVDSNLFVVDEAPTSLAAGSSATVDITYSPLALETRSLASVVFNGSGGQMATLSVFGEPVGVALVVAIRN